MRLSFILIAAFALALPISAQAGSKGGGGLKTTVSSATGGSGAGKASPSLAKHVAKGTHYDQVILH